MNHEVPDVSVVIPTKDRWPFLRLTLQSVLAQRGVSLEVIVVDDGSRDETPARLAALDDPRVRVRRNERSRGDAVARNVGIGDAQGAWVALLDDDDLWSPEKLERQLAAAEAAGAAFAYAAAALVNEDLEVLEVVPPPSPNDLLRGLLTANVLPAGASNVVVRTEVLRQVGGFDEGLAQLSDWDLWIRLARTAPAAACDEALVACRLHRGNRVLHGGAKVIEDVDRLAAKHAELAAREGVKVDRILATRWIAWARRREGRRLSAATMYMRGAVRYRSPGDVARALGALLGERAMGIGGVASRAAPGDLAWLEPYRSARS